MYIPRALGERARFATRNFPAILVTGPRQAGKTTFLREEFPEAAYRTFDDPAVRAFAQEDPHAFLDQWRGRPVILDEIQYVPSLFSHIKMRIDQERHRCGAWLMTGSQQFAMMRDVSDSLAGRVAVLELLPFHLGELPKGPVDIEMCLWRGGYPEIVVNPEVRSLWLASYVQTYLERDVRQLMAVQDLRLFQVFLGLVAARHGQELNLADVSRQAGVSQPTAKRWLSLLAASFIISLLPSYHANLGKRLVKSPKVYFLDSALAAYLTRQPDAAALFAGAMAGAFFEGFLIMETQKILATKDRAAKLSFWRSHDGIEVDLLLEVGQSVYPLEFKKTATPTAVHAEGLRRFRALSEGKLDVATSRVVCQVTDPTRLPGGVEVLPWRDYLAWVEEL